MLETLDSLNRHAMDALSVLGEWHSNTVTKADLKTRFESADPFPFIVIPNFLTEEAFEAASTAFPAPSLNHETDKAAGWHVYDNPIEGKFALDDMSKFPENVRKVYCALFHEDFVKIMEEVTGTQGLELDPYHHGAGLHCHPHGGKLDKHLDYSIHPKSGKERRLNLILFLHPWEWREEWRGCLKLWDTRENNKAAASLLPQPNTAVLFRTSDESWHGLPDLLLCPADKQRRSMAIYYASEPRKHATHRLKAEFVASGTDEERFREGTDEMRKIRVHRRLTKEDVQRFTPEWHSPMMKQ
jgi:hypothetical protein